MKVAHVQNSSGGGGGGKSTNEKHAVSFHYSKIQVDLIG